MIQLKFQSFVADMFDLVLKHIIIGLKTFIHRIKSSRSRIISDEHDKLELHV